MSNQLIAAIVLTCAAFSQPVRPPDARQIELDPARPREVVATLDGKDITAEEFQQLIIAMDPKAKEAARNSASEMLRYVGWLRRMGAEAEKARITRRQSVETPVGNGADSVAFKRSHPTA